MEVKVRDSTIDVAILAGPRLKQWPTQGLRVLSRHCADAGLRVGWYGGPGLQVRGVLPAEGSGGVVMLEDAQKRLHRIQAKSIVKIVPHVEFPLPFQGWYSPGLIPEATARKLLAQGSLNWQPVVVILGSGNRALKLGSELIQKRVANRVVCVESVFEVPQGWEVERRKFEVLGGKIIFGKPNRLVQKSPFLWELKIQDAQGLRVIDTARVISVGPFDEDHGFREYPAGSFLVEWENTEAQLVSQDVEQVLLDEHRATVLAGRIIKGIGAGNVDAKTAEFRSQFDRQLWASKQKLKELESTRDRRFQWKYDGKWLDAQSKTLLAEFSGTPKNLEPSKIMASIECVESIGCRVCEKACPANAIKIERDAQGVATQFLIEDACTGCGFCLQACPSQVPVMIERSTSESFTTLILPYRETPILKKGDRVGLLNRRGELLANSRVLDQFLDGEVPLFKIEVPSHLEWETRGVVSLVPRNEYERTDDIYEEKGARVEVQIQGDVRRVREGQLISVALFENGMARPNDVLVCEDGSCGLCQVEVDGIRKLACESTIHQGMSIRFTREHEQSSELCPCNGVTLEELESKCEFTNPDTMEALAQVTDVGQGKCHGLLCKKSCMRVAENAGVETERYVDWAFPWADWVFK
jgi:ferredoxin/aerobic-type carbon monoxide dehydrogenase small subunit (CoxS/CutS family)